MTRNAKHQRLIKADIKLQSQITIKHLTFAAT